MHALHPTLQKQRSTKKGDNEKIAFIAVVCDLRHRLAQRNHHEHAGYSETCFCTSVGGPKTACRHVVNAICRTSKNGPGRLPQVVSKPSAGTRTQRGR